MADLWHIVKGLCIPREVGKICVLLSDLVSAGELVL